MSTLLKELGLYTYEGYLEAFESWVQNHQSSKPGASEAFIAYTRLNWVRTNRLHKTIVINPELKRAVGNIQHVYSWMVLTEPWCGDSAQNLPVIAELAKLNPEKIKLYILLRDENPELMDKYLTGGARAIPKLMAVNDSMGKESFLWGPRPAPAQELLKSWKSNSEGKSWEAFETDLHAWYAKDRTRTIQEEFLAIFKRLN